MQAIKSPSLDYSHFVSLPLAIHPELVEKLINFQNSILGSSESCLDEVEDSDTNEDNTDNEVEDQQTVKAPDVAVELKVEDQSEQIKVNINIPLVSYAPKASKTAAPSGMITTEHCKGSGTCNSHKVIGIVQFLKHDGENIFLLFVHFSPLNLLLCKEFLACRYQLVICTFLFPFPFLVL